MAMDSDELLIFKERQGRINVPVAGAKPAKTAPKASVMQTPSQAGYTVAEAEKEPAKSRSDKKNEMCIWHPWRKAFDICAYCDRPFCFEDL
ncbi:MAG: hypothetical protein QXN59_03165, partial [Candidatus Micrarchaeaceae archaeon]